MTTGAIPPFDQYQMPGSDPGTGPVTGGIFTGGKLTTALDFAGATTLAAASTVNIGGANVNTIFISGSVQINAFDNYPVGAMRRVVFTGGPILQYNAVSMILPTSANITAAVGDSALFYCLGSGNWRCVQYQRQDGTALVGSGGGGGGTVLISGTPSAGQTAEWTAANTIQGVPVTGTGNYVKATGPTLVTPALGTPTSVTLTNATGLPVSTGISGFAANVAAFLANPTSANFAAMMTNETGTAGFVVMSNSPSIAAPTLTGSVTRSSSVDVVVPNAMGALAIAITEMNNTKSISVDSTFTFSAALTVAGTWFGMTLKNTDTNPHLISMPSVIDANTGLTVSTSAFRMPASTTRKLLFEYDGTNVIMYNSTSTAGRQLTVVDASQTTVMADANNEWTHTSGSAHTYTIDSNANVPYPVGTVLVFSNQNGGGTVTIALTTDTMRLLGAGTTGNRSLAANGVAIARKVTTTSWQIGGTGVT